MQVCNLLLQGFIVLLQLSILLRQPGHLLLQLLTAGPSGAGWGRDLHRDLWHMSGRAWSCQRARELRICCVIDRSNRWASWNDTHALVMNGAEGFCNVHLYLQMFNYARPSRVPAMLTLPCTWGFQQMNYQPCFCHEQHELQHASHHMQSLYWLLWHGVAGDAAITLLSEQTKVYRECAVFQMVEQRMGRMPSGWALIAKIGKQS